MCGFLLSNYLKKTVRKRQEGKLFFKVLKQLNVDSLQNRCTVHFLIPFLSPFYSLNFYVMLTLSAGEIKVNIIDTALEILINCCGIDTLTDNPS